MSTQEIIDELKSLNERLPVCNESVVISCMIGNLLTDTPNSKLARTAAAEAAERIIAIRAKQNQTPELS